MENHSSTENTDKMNWKKILSVPPNELSSEDLESIPNHLCSVDPNELSNEELKKFFELNRFLINHLFNDRQEKLQTKKDSLLEKKLAKSSDTDESYYIQTIQELNREIAQHVFNKKSSTENCNGNVVNNTDTDSLQPSAIDSKRDLLYKIHVKNKYIKRLLNENEALKADIDEQKEQILLLNVSSREKSHKLNKAIADLSEQKNQNHMTADDMADLHAKINSVREQMTRVEVDKQKYKNDVLYLGDEIQKKINQWNDLLKKKYSNYQSDGKPTTNSSENIRSLHDDVDHKANALELSTSRCDENRFEVIILSQVINKRNVIITEMESLLIDLTMEISQSASVINRIIANLSKREINFACNLEKLHNHLARFLEYPNASDHEAIKSSIVCNKTDKSEHTHKRVSKKRNSSNAT